MSLLFFRDRFRRREDGTEGATLAFRHVGGGCCGGHTSTRSDPQRGPISNKVSIRTDPVCSFLNHSESLKEI